MHSLILQIAFKMHSIRWNRSRNYIRLGLLMLILIFSVPYDASTLYCYLSPVPMPAPKNDTTISRLQSLSKLLVNSSESQIWESFFSQPMKPKVEKEDSEKIKCYEDLNDVDGILEWSR